MNYLTELLDAKHHKKEFSCGKTLLDDYIRKYASQDVKRKLSACFVLAEQETNIIKGYYTLSNSSIPLELVPKDLRKKLPKSYNSIPATLLGRLAIDNRFKGKGFGKMLLIDALKRSVDASKRIGSFALIVDPLDDDAKQFYSQYGFIELPDSGKLFLPMNSIKQLFE